MAPLNFIYIIIHSHRPKLLNPKQSRLYKFTHGCSNVCVPACECVSVYVRVAHQTIVQSINME